MYKISSQNLNGYEIQDLVDSIEEYYKICKENNVEMEVLAHIKFPRKQRYPKVRFVDVEVKKLLD